MVEKVLTCKLSDLSSASNCWMCVFVLLCHAVHWDLNSPIRDQTWTSYIRSRSPNYWTARETPRLLLTRYV